MNNDGTQKHSGKKEGQAPAYRFLLMKMDANPVMAIIAGGIEAMGAEKQMLRPTPISERIDITSA
jgi:hypothetical protein